MRTLLLLCLLAPCFAYAQLGQGDYDIYSEYLKVHTAQSGKEKILFVIRSSTADFDGNMANDVIETINPSAAYIRNHSDQSMRLRFGQVDKEVLTDSLWARIVDNLKSKFKDKLVVKNRFAADLDISIMSDSQYHSYFGSDDYDENWERFHEDYPMPSAVVQFSPISSDGKRAVFYVSRRCNPLCGTGSLIYFKKDGNNWKYLGAENIWYN